MREWLGKDVFFGLTLIQVILIGVGIWLAGRIWGYINDPARKRLVQKNCSACSWTGVVDRKNFACPKCKAQLREVRQP
ncbi:MAG: hypothetical protein HY791_34050 [Deltaproteobacteria bacterium]|nr:hypothetical protein [Deltaproteobacteria bacterium]